VAIHIIYSLVIFIYLNYLDEMVCSNIDSNGLVRKGEEFSGNNLTAAISVGLSYALST